MKLKFLGRGSAFNTKEGNTSAFIKENNSLFIIDCGSNIFERIIKENLLDDITEVNIALSHRHPDHVGSLGDLIFYCYYIKNIKVGIFSEDEFIEDFLLLNGITKEKYTRYYNGYIGNLDLHIQFIYSIHVGIYKNAYDIISNEYRESDNSKDIFNCYSIILKYKDKKIFYSGDCKYVDFWNIRDFDEYYIDTCFANYPNNVHYNIDLLYKDCSIGAGIDISKIYCMHLDCDEIINRAKELGFNVVENYQSDTLSVLEKALNQPTLGCKSE